ncbi:MAG: rRNA ((1498)-N(3))-methyltransferase [Pseudomonadota bacterium]|nr:rRNA ((1498)-N(3))-methyltransferase [Pseudomonadota bacterium]
MRIPRFYLPIPLAAGMTAPLDDHVFNHAVRVLRLGVNAPCILFDGQGSAFAATLIEVGKRSAAAQVLEAVPSATESPLRITLAQGISRGEKMDYTLQKAVELGVTAIQPLFTERSGVQLSGERLARKIQHWQGIVIGACEQCGRDRLPELREPVAFMDGLAPLTAAPGLGLLLDPLAEQGLRDLTPPSGPMMLLIGSEGGLSPGELARARTVGFVGVRLGPRILRTETAGVAALAAIQALWGDCG